MDTGHLAEWARPALGLSIGATDLAAVTAERDLARRPVLTLYHQRPAEVGVPPENPAPALPGIVIADFVDRTNDTIVAIDGSAHRGEVVLAHALRALAYTTTAGHALPENLAVTYPAHWEPSAVEALRAALSRLPEGSDLAHPLTLIPDAAATLLAARANPRIPALGTIAVCDFGGSGTSITLIRAPGDHRPLAPTLRYRDFSGNLIDQALLDTVLADLPDDGIYDPTAPPPARALSRLRAGCRNAKEQLSSDTVAALPELRGGEVPDRPERAGRRTPRAAGKIRGCLGERTGRQRDS